MNTLNLDILDGVYEVHSCNQERLDYTVDADGMTEIRNGSTLRKDKNGYIWESKFAITGTDTVEMVSSVDPSHVSGKYLRDKHGERTTSILTFHTVLTATWKDNRLILTGLIEHGPEKIYLKMVRISG